MIGKLNEDYKSLQQKIEKEKKRGVDTLIDELKLEQVPFKIKMFSLSGTKDDYYVVKRLLALIK